MATVRELRNREMRDQLRTLDKVQLQVRIRQAVSDGSVDGFVDALEGAPAGFEIAPKHLVEEARAAIAERDHPRARRTRNAHASVPVPDQQRDAGRKSRCRRRRSRTRRTGRGHAPAVAPVSWHSPAGCEGVAK